MLVHKGGKIKNWMGIAEMLHLQNCSLKIYLKRARGVGLGGQDGCERRIKDFVKFQKKKMGGGGVRVDVNREVKFL